MWARCGAVANGRQCKIDRQSIPPPQLKRILCDFVSGGAVARLLDEPALPAGHPLRIGLAKLTPVGQRPFG
jgi:hypothetical protein